MEALHLLRIQARANRLTNLRLHGAMAPLTWADLHAPRTQGRIQTEAAAHMLQHLFMHQMHHRGQVHAILSGTAVPTPQLDEFMMPSEAHLRSAEMAQLG